MKEGGLADLYRPRLLHFQPSQPLLRIFNFWKAGIGVFPISFHLPESPSDEAAPESGDCHAEGPTWDTR